MDFKPTKELQSNPLKRCLRRYVVPPLTRNYQVVSIRAMLPDDTVEGALWVLRRALEKKLNGTECVRAFISCITGLMRKGEFVLIL